MKWLAVALVLAAQPARAADPAAVMGLWWTPEKDGVVEMYRCPAGLCGRVAGVVNFQPDGSAPLDLHGRSRCHLTLINGGKPDADGVWDSRITNPDDDKTYSIRLRVDPDGRMRMRGYIGLPLLGQTVFWTRFDRRILPDCHIG